MRIALDATYSIGGHLSGVGVYSRRILLGLAAAHPEARFIFCYRPHRFLRSLTGPLPRNCRRRLLFENWFAAPRGLFHGLNQRLPARGWKHRVATFHDLFVLTGDYSTPEFRLRFARQAREAARRADLVIAVSEFTASQVEALLAVERARIRVVHHGVCLPPPGVRPARENRILHVGAIQRRKNLLRLIEAFETLDSDWTLTLAGGDGFGADQVRARVNASPARQRIELPGYVSPAQLEDLYARASLLAFPSLDEGFGMPVLEAMARGIPVLTADRSALREVAADAALLADPFSVEAIRDGLRRLINSPELRAELTAKGLRRAAHFSWDTAVARTWNVYQELLR